MVSDAKTNCTLISVFQVGPIQTDKGTTIDKASSRGTVTDEQAIKLVLISLFKDGDAIGIACKNILTIFWESLIGRVVSTIVHLVGAFFCSESFGIGNLDTEFALDIFDDVGRTVRRLFFDFFSDLFCEKGSRRVRVTLVIEAKTRVFRLICLDTVEGGSVDRRGMETPSALFCLTEDCITTFVGLEDLKLERVLDGVEFARVFELVKIVERSPDEELRCIKVHTR